MARSARWAAALASIWSLGWLTDLAVQAGVRQLALFHHDPTHADRFVDDMVATVQQREQRQGSEIFVFGAREGVELRIGEPAHEAATAGPIDVA